MTHEASATREVARCAAIRWCEPDADMEQFTASASSWIKERAEYFSDAFRSLGIRVPDCELSYTRSLGSFSAAWLESIRKGSAQGSWFDCFEQARAMLPPIEGRLLELSAETATRVTEQRDQSERWTVGLGNPFDARRPSWWERMEFELSLDLRWIALDSKPEESSLWSKAPGIATCQLHVCWNYVFGEEKTSPWEALIACFERGCWPMVNSDGLVVYVPILTDFGFAEESGSPTAPILLKTLAEDVGLKKSRDLGLPSPPKRILLAGLPARV